MTHANISFTSRPAIVERKTLHEDAVAAISVAKTAKRFELPEEVKDAPHGRYYLRFPYALRGGNVWFHLYGSPELLDTLAGSKIVAKCAVKEKVFADDTSELYVDLVLAEQPATHRLVVYAVEADCKFPDEGFLTDAGRHGFLQITELPARQERPQA